MTAANSPFEGFRRQAQVILYAPVENANEAVALDTLATTRCTDNILSVAYDDDDPRVKIGTAPIFTRATECTGRLINTMLQHHPENANTLTQLDILLASVDTMMEQLGNDAITLAYADPEMYNDSYNEGEPLDEDGLDQKFEQVAADIAFLDRFLGSLEGLCTKGTLLRKRDLQHFAELLDEHAILSDLSSKGWMDYAADTGHLQEARIDSQAREFYWRLVSGQATDMEHPSASQQITNYLKSTYESRPSDETILAMHEYLPREIFAAFLRRADEIRNRLEVNHAPPVPEHLPETEQLFEEIKLAVREYIPGIEPVPGVEEEKHAADIAAKLGVHHRHGKNVAKLNAHDSSQMLQTQETVEKLAAIWQYDLHRDNPR